MNTDLAVGAADPSDREHLLQSLVQSIQVKPQTSDLFTITYRDASPKLAHDVVQALLSTFVESATGTNRADMENAKRFLEHQIASDEQQLRAAEQRRADFRTKYPDILSYTSATEAARNSVRARRGLQDAVITRDALRRNLPTRRDADTGHGKTDGGSRRARSEPGLRSALAGCGGRCRRRHTAAPACRRG